MNFKTVLKTAALATALAFSTAGHAADTYKHVLTNPEGEFFMAIDGSLMTPSGGQIAITAPVYTMVGTAGTGNQPDYLAFCIEPNVGLVGNTTYTRNLSFNFSATFGEKANVVQALYETSYSSLLAGTIGNSLTADEQREAFQLALWDASHDDANLFGGTQFFFVAGNPGTDDGRVVAAQEMLLAANANATPEKLTNKYHFISFTGMGEVDGVATASQQLMSVSAVPEADTWAMLTAGLGLIGFMGRRRSKQSEKFAA